MKKLLYFLVAIGLLIAVRASAVNVTVPQSRSQNSIPLGLTNGNYTNGYLVAGSGITVNTSTVGQITIISTGGIAQASTTSIQWVDGNRTDSYTQNGTIINPYKTVSAAVASSTSFSGYVYNLAPATYVDVPGSSFPSNSVVIQGNGSTYVPIATAMTLQSSFDIYDLTIVGDVIETDNSLTAIHKFNNGVITGNTTVAGLGLFNDQTFTGTTSSVTVKAGALTNFAGSLVYPQIVNNGILNFNDSEMISNSSNYGIISSTTGSSVNISGATFIQTGSGGAINVNNGATSTPNFLTSLSILSNTTSPLGIVNAGNAATSFCNYYASNLTGTRLYGSGTNWIPCTFESVSIHSNLLLVSSTPNTLLSTDTNKNVVSTALVAGSNISVTTSTPGIIVVASTGNQNITVTGVATGTGTTSLNLTFGATDFATSTAGNGFNISTTTSQIIYNMPTASASLFGQLSNTDWTTFNNKVGTSRQILTTSPLQGGGDLSADRTLFINQASTTGAGYLTAADWQAFNNKVGGSGGANQIAYFTAASTTASSANHVWFNTAQMEGINTGTPIATLSIQASSSAQSLPIFNVASNTLGSILQILPTAQILACTSCELTIPQGVNPTLSSSGDIAVDTTAGQLLYQSSSAVNVLDATTTKTMTIINPTANENDDFFVTDIPITITKVVCNVRQSNTSSITFNLAHSLDRSNGQSGGSGALFAAGQVCTATTTPQSFISFNDNTLAAGEVLWATSSATTLASTSSFTIYFKKDRQ